MATASSSVQNHDGFTPRLDCSAILDSSSLIWLNRPVSRNAFQQIARLSGGAYCSFDAGSGQQLRELLAAVAVFSAGGRRALADLGKAKGGRVLQIADQMNGKR